MRITERLEKIKQMVKKLDLSDAILEMKDLAGEYNKEEVTDCFVDDEIMNYMTKNRLDTNDWTGVACFLAKVNSLNDDFFYIDGYENANNYTKETVETVLYNLENILQEEINEEEPLHVGDKFIITETDDLDLEEWYDEQEDKILVAKTVEYDAWGVWTENCPYRIDLSEIEKIEED